MSYDFKKRYWLFYFCKCNATHILTGGKHIPNYADYFICWEFEVSAAESPKQWTEMEFRLWFLNTVVSTSKIHIGAFFHERSFVY